MLPEKFSLRLSALREQKGVSARDMSLSLGQNSGYINNIENGKSLPSMAVFFYICEYLQISEKDFFDTEIKDPRATNEIINKINSLNKEQYSVIMFLLDTFTSK